MNYVKKFTAIQLIESTINEEVVAQLKFGNITGPFYNKKYPDIVFDSEEDAIKFAYNENEYSRWLILPIIEFEN